MVKGGGFVYPLPMTFTKTEQEAIVLNAVWAMIDDMVNFAIFMPLDGRTQNTNLMPQRSDTLRLFHVLLGEFLSPLVREGEALACPSICRNHRAALGHLT